MKLRALFTSSFIGIALALSAANSSTKMPEGPLVKVLLAKDARSALLEARGGYHVVRKDTGSVLSSGHIGKRFVIHAIHDGLRWGEEYPDIFAVTLVPDSPETLVYVNGYQYRGAVSVYHTKDNRIMVINEVSIEDFLKSTLAVQFDQPFAKEAMAAMVIAARTNVYGHLVDSASRRPWDITATEAGYFGTGVTMRKNGVDQIVDLTRHMVMEMKRDGSPVRDVTLTPSRAEEMANRGFDARKILETAYPQTKLNIPKEVHVR